MAPWTIGFCAAARGRNVPASAILTAKECIAATGSVSVLFTFLTIVCVVVAAAGAGIAVILYARRREK